MAELKTPTFPESVLEGTILDWNVSVGDYVEEGDIIVEIETDKIIMEVPAVGSGVITEIQKEAGDTVKSEELLAMLDESAKAPTNAEVEAKKEVKKEEIKTEQKAEDKVQTQELPEGVHLTPSSRKAFNAGASLEEVRGFVPSDMAISVSSQRFEKRTKMSRLRQTVAKRLLEVQQNNAILTTFNEVNMSAVMQMRKKLQDKFVAKHGRKLGFMSFFVRAVTEALKEFPDVNSSIDGEEIVYHNYFDVGIAVGTDRGLVVPVIRDADNLSFANIEKDIADKAVLARDGKLAFEDMQGGTFTITNGGTYGSMLSTPIINAPQSAILGMHNIVERPVAINGEVKIRPIMYLALSYDHRIIDGKTSISFLKMVKELLEDPSRMLFDV